MVKTDGEFHGRFKLFLERMTGPRSLAFTDRRYFPDGARPDLRLVVEKFGSAGTLEVPGVGKLTVEEIESDVAMLANALIVPLGKFAKTLLLVLGAAFVIFFFPGLLIAILLPDLYFMGLLYSMFSFLLVVMSLFHRLAMRNVKEAFTKHAPVLRRLRYLELYMEFASQG
ncbi:MAG: hypothetical protein Q6370_003370 [Candidatus Sigynarchaeota archaeon]